MQNPSDRLKLKPDSFGLTFVAARLVKSPGSDLTIPSNRASERWPANEPGGFLPIAFGFQGFDYRRRSLTLRRGSH